MIIKFIICDLGGVYFTDGTTIALPKIKQLVKRNNEIVNELFRESPRKEGYLLRIGKLSSKEFWEIVSKKLNLNTDEIYKIKKIWHSSYKPKEGMVELIRKLRKNYKVVAFSGNIKERIQYLDKKYNLLKEFDNYVFSFDHGVNKGDPKFFKKLFEVVKANPGECLFIDDKVEFIEIAKGLGMKTILFKNAEQLKNDLINFGVNL